MVYLNQQMELRPENIDSFSDRMAEALSGHGLEKQDILRLRLAVEELLLRLRGHFGAEITCTVRVRRIFLHWSVDITYAGEVFDPTSENREEGGAWSEKILENMGLAPTWSYSRGVNRLVLHPPTGEKKGMMSFFISIGAGILFGLLGTFLPEGFRTRAAEMVLTPVFNAFLGLLGTFTGLMVFFSITSGICGISDTAAFGRIGRVMLFRFCGLTVLWSAIVNGLCMLFYSVYFGAMIEGQSQINQILSFIYGDRKSVV